MVIFQMQPDALLIVTTVIKSLFFFFILSQGIRLGIWRGFHLIYTYLSLHFLAFWLQGVAFIQVGPADPVYYWVFYGSSIPVDLLAVVILLRVYYLAYGPSARRDWPLLVMLPVFIALSFSQPMFWGYRISYVTYSCQAIMGFLAISRYAFSTKLTIGSNLDWLTYGITVPATLQTIYQTMVYLGADIWPYSAFRVVSELTTVISWGMIAYGTRRYDPPRFSKSELSLDSQEAVSRLKRLQRLLRR